MAKRTRKLWVGIGIASIARATVASSLDAQGSGP